MTRQQMARRPATGALIAESSLAALRKLNPRDLHRSPVLLVVAAGALLTTLLWFVALVGDAEAGRAPFVGGVALWLWLTVLSGNFAEALAEGRGRAHAVSLRRARAETLAVRLREPRADAPHDAVAADELRRGDCVLVVAGGIIPADGEVISGAAAVDESAITGESAPVIREAGGDRSAVTGGTRVLSDRLVIRVTAAAGEGFLDRMIRLVEGARRQKTPNEVALGILLAALTITFLAVTASLVPISGYVARAAGQGAAVSLTVVIALLVCLMPTTIGGLLSAIGIAGMDRLLRANVVATSGRAVEAAGDVGVLLLDKTGTITLGDRQATAFVPAPGIGEHELAEAAQLASLADETPEGRSIVVLAKQRFGLRAREFAPGQAAFVPFTAQTRMSGVDVDGRRLRKGAPDAVAGFLASGGGRLPVECQAEVARAAKAGATPLVVADGPRALGIVVLKDVVKGGLRLEFDEMRRLGIRTVMITGDNPLTAAAIAAEAGVDDFVAEARPETKLAEIRRWQAAGHLVAMTGDGTNDAPALAQADVAVVMGSGTQAAKEAGNMVDLDSNPTKLLAIVGIGKRLLMTRGALTTFSIASDVAKYFAIIPAAFATTCPELGALDVMRLGSPQSAVLAAVIFNALIIVALVPVALRGVPYRPAPSATLLRRNLLLYGLGGLVLPFPGIKLIDMLLGALGVGGGS